MIWRIKNIRHDKRVRDYLYQIADSSIEMSAIALNPASASDLCKSPLEDIVLTLKTCLFSQTDTVLVNQNLLS